MIDGAMDGTGDWYAIDIEGILSSSDIYGCQPCTKRKECNSMHKKWP